ncbi:AAA family ATPase [Candidatus Sumerlaeota bacterium]|nr:AAA family ATPase [Candidatus Sumerlaeota bacterium]
MYIRRVVIKNFRNLRSIDVNLEPGMTCLVGENNSGKTNFLFALQLVLDMNLPNYYRTLVKEDFSNGIDISTPQQVLVGIELTDYYHEDQVEKVKELALVQEWSVEKDVARICYRFRPTSAVIQAIKSEERDGTDLTIEEYEYELVGGAVTDDNGNLKDLLDIEWNDDFDVFVKMGRLSAFRVTFLPALRDVEDDLRRTATSPLSKLLDVIDIPQDKKNELVERIKRANDEVSDQSEIKDLAYHINTSLEYSVGSKFALDVRLGMASPTFSSISRALRVLLSGQGLEEADPSRNGLGLNNVLYISMILAYFEKRMEQSNTAGQLLLIEEPEAHLHPQLQRVLFGRLLERKCQIISTSHSTHISSRANLKNLLVFTQELDSMTSFCKPVLTPGINENDISDLERYLDATKSVLLFARKVILVEGMSEVFLIPSLVKKVMDVDLEEYGVSVVPIHGVHFEVYMKLFGDKVIRKKCAVLTDGDLKPSDANIEEDSKFPRIQELKKFENDFVKVFHCKTTFERAIAMPCNLMVFSMAAAELGANRMASDLEKYYNQNANLEDDEKKQDMEKVLSMAKRFGKARFAQVASKYVEHAKKVPPYIMNAVKWIIE